MNQLDQRRDVFQFNMSTENNGTNNQSNPVVKDNDEEVKEVSSFRRAFPQILACSAKNLLMIDLGLALGFSTIVIPVLLGLQPERYPDETMHFTAEEASWFGSLAFLTQPIGSIVSGWITEQIGRKRAMLIVNVPHIIAWAMLYFAQTNIELFVAGVLLGLGVGLMESPIMTYVGEISHPSIRGPLLAFSNLSVMFGSFAMYLLGTVATWRQCCFICFFVPIITIVAITFVPESPYWLMSQNRHDEAIQSLQWLRGWVKPVHIAPEYQEITEYIDVANRCDACLRLGQSCPHISSYAEKAKDLVRTKTLRPLMLVALVFFVVHANGNSAVRPFLVQVFQTFRVPMDPNWASVVVGCMDILSNVLCIFAVKMVGKRCLFLVSLAVSCVCCLALGVNAYLVIPAGANSFAEHVPVGADSVMSATAPAQDNVLAMVLFVVLALSFGVSWCCPWMLVSEVFPFRVRGTASGIAAAFNYFAVFTVTKTYLSLERVLDISGAFVLYGVLLIIGFVVLYVVFPETEGRSLQEIEYYFSDKTRKITDRHIRRVLPINETALSVSVSSTFSTATTIAHDNKAFAP